MIPLGPADIAIIIFWLALTFGVGVSAGLRADAESYWVNRRFTGTAPLVFTVSATQVGAGALIGMASAVFSTGLGFPLVSLVSTVIGFLLVAYLAPAIKRFGDRYRAITLLELFGVRYGAKVQAVAGCVLAFTYLSILAAQFLASSWLLAVGTGWSIKLAVVLATFGVVIYSAFAGIRGDVVTDALHFWAMAGILFGLLLPILLITEPPSRWLADIPPHIWSPFTFGGPAFLAVGLAVGVMVPLLSPELWVKIYASRGAAQARRVFVLSALAIFPFYAFAIFLGLFGYAHYAGKVGGDQLLFRIMADYMPRAIYSLGLAAILSVAISTSNTLIVVLSATVYRDILRLDYSALPLSSARWLSGGVGAAAALLALAKPDIVQQLINGYYVLLALLPSLIGVVAWDRATSRGALASIVAGVGVTVAGLLVVPRLAFLPGLAVAAVVFVVGSLASAHSAEEVRAREKIVAL